MWRRSRAIGSGAFRAGRRSIRLAGSGLGLAFNRWMYRVRARIFRTRVAARCRFAASRRRRPKYWTSAPAAVLSRPLAAYGRPKSFRLRSYAGSVAKLSLFPGVEVSQADIGDERVPFEPGSFDAISCMDVLFHIVDDARYERAILTCASLLRPGGILLFTDNFLHGGSIRIAHQASRSLQEIETSIASAGLTVIERRPVFVLMNTPVDSHSRPLQFFWRVLNAVVRRYPALGSPAGMTLYPPELFLSSVLREGLSTEMMICRR